MNGCGDDNRSDDKIDFVPMINRGRSTAIENLSIYCDKFTRRVKDFAKNGKMFLKYVDCCR